MDWLHCKVIEQIPGKVSGAPLIKGSRVRPEDILNNLDLSEDEIADSFDLSKEDVHEVVAFWHRYADQLTPTS